MNSQKLYQGESCGILADEFKFISFGEMNYNNKKFKTVSNSENGEISENMIFHYKQEGNLLTCKYAGGEIIKGHLIGLVDKNGVIDMRYHQLNKKNALMTGICKSTPENMPNGKIRLIEEWQWTSGDLSK